MGLGGGNIVEERRKRGGTSVKIQEVGEWGRECEGRW